MRQDVVLLKDAPIRSPAQAVADRLALHAANLNKARDSSPMSLGQSRLNPEKDGQHQGRTARSGPGLV